MNPSTSRPASGSYRETGVRLGSADVVSNGSVAARAPHHSWLHRGSPQLPGSPTPSVSRTQRPTAAPRRNWGERLLWAAFLLVAAVGALWEFVHLPDASARLDAIPESGFGFAARELPLSESERAIFGNARVLKRLYQVGRQRAVLQVIDASRDRHAVHDPLFCFHGAGWHITEDASIPIPGGNARYLAMRRPEKTAEAVLWFSDSRTRHASAMRQWVQTILRRVTFGASGPEPVLIIVQPVAGETLNWDEFFEQFPALFEI